MVFQTISDNIRDFVRDEHGASSSEYALILGVIGVGVGAATLMLGANVGASMNGKAASFDPGFTGGSDTGSAGGGNGNGSGGNGSARLRWRKRPNDRSAASSGWRRRQRRALVSATRHF